MSGEGPGAGEPALPGEPAVPPRAPWHFKLLVVSAGGYLAWRGLQGLAWLAGRL